jgi:hypothetical protein
LKITNAEKKLFCLRCNQAIAIPVLFIVWNQSDRDFLAQFLAWECTDWGREARFWGSGIRHQETEDRGQQFVAAQPPETLVVPVKACLRIGADDGEHRAQP